MNTRDFYFRQPLKENEMDAFASDVEAAMWKIVKDLKLYGLASGVEVTEVSPLILNVAAFTGYDLQGRRLSAGAFSGLDITNDTLGNPNTPSAAHFRWVSLVARHGYLKSDSRTDGNAATVYFIRTEMISSTGDDTIASAGLLEILQGAEAASSGAAVKPTLTSSDDLVIADVLINDTGAIVANGISYSRQQQIPAFAVQYYNSLNSYFPGQVVIYLGQMYQSETTVPPGIAPTNQSYWHVFGRSPTLGSFSSPAASFMNARRQPVAGFDHWGFPTGKLVRVEDNWLNVDHVNKVNTGTGVWAGPWKYYVNNGGGLAGSGIEVPGVLDITSQPWGPCCQMNVFGQSVDAAAAIELRQPVVYMGQASFEMEWAFSLDAGGGSGVPLSNTGWAMGISFGGVVSGNSPDPIRGGTADYQGFYIYGRGSDAQWSALVDNGSDPGVGVSTGVGIVVNQPHFAKLVIVGTSAGDDGAARCLLFIDGVNVVNEAITMAGKLITPFFRVNASQGEVMKLSIGPWDAQARLALNSEFGP